MAGRGAAKKLLANETLPNLKQVGQNAVALEFAEISREGPPFLEIPEKLEAEIRETLDKHFGVAPSISEINIKVGGS